MCRTGLAALWARIHSLLRQFNVRQENTLCARPCVSANFPPLSLAVKPRLSLTRSVAHSEQRRDLTIFQHAAWLRYRVAHAVTIPCDKLHSFGGRGLSTLHEARRKNWAVDRRSHVTPLVRTHSFSLPTDRGTGLVDQVDEPRPSQPPPPARDECPHGHHLSSPRLEHDLPAPAIELRR